MGPASRSRARATSWSGTRTPTVDVAETASGRDGFFGTRTVSGPGQKRAISLAGIHGDFFATCSRCPQHLRSRRDCFFDRPILGRVNRFDCLLVECKRTDAIDGIGWESDQPAVTQDFKGAGDRLGRICRKDFCFHGQTANLQQPVLAGQILDANGSLLPRTYRRPG